VSVINSAVFCNCRRLDRTPDVRTMSLMTDSATILPAHSERSLRRMIC
jgi:hypothetical protein